MTQQRPLPTSSRLRYQELGSSDVDAFHRLVVDRHIKRFLLDGNTMPRPWVEGEVKRSQHLFDQSGVGLWLFWGNDREDASPIGFCGFRVFPELSEQPQLLYALREAFTGQGYATEIARTLVHYALTHAGFTEVVAAVDEPNVASIRVLQKAGFHQSGQKTTGPFGQTLLFCRS